MKHFAIITSVCALLSASAPAFAVSTQPKAGAYTVLSLVLSNSVSGAGSCNDAKGSYYTSTFYYPGPSAKGAFDTRPISLPGLFYILELTYPETPAAGATSWSGKIAAVYQPGNIKGSISFTSTIVYMDNHSFLVDSTTVYVNSAGGTCTSNEQANYILQGK